jgi:hypothetical protein
MTHARGRGKVPSERSTRWRAGVPEAPCPGPRQARKTGDPRRPRDPRRRLLRAKGRPPLGAAAPRLPAPGDRSLAVREAARGWDPRTAQRRPARAPAESPGHEPAPERGYSRPPDGRDHGGRRRAGRLRRRQGDPGHKAPPPGGHRRVGPRGQGPQRGGARPGRPEAAVGAGARRALAPRAPAPRAPAAGRRLRGKGREVGRGGHGLECGGRARAAQARTRGGGEGVGRGAGRGGGKKPDWGRLMPPRGRVALPRRRVVERALPRLGHNRRTSKDREGLCAGAEAFVYAATIRPMVRRPARGRAFPNSFGRRFLGTSRRGGSEKPPRRRMPRRRVGNG